MRPDLYFLFWFVQHCFKHVHTKFELTSFLPKSLPSFIFINFRQPLYRHQLWASVGIPLARCCCLVRRRRTQHVRTGWMNVHAHTNACIHSLKKQAHGPNRQQISPIFCSCSADMSSETKTEKSGLFGFSPQHRSVSSPAETCGGGGGGTPQAPPVLRVPPLQIPLAQTSNDSRKRRSSTRKLS